MDRRAHVSMPPPYVSFSTFRTLREWLGEEGVPLRFDRSFWESKFSGSTGTQLVAALRFLGLLSLEQPQQGMERMAEASIVEWRLFLAGLLQDSYTAVPFDELPRATPAMVRGWFRAYPVDGHTLRKAISFFVNAAKEADLPMSNGVRKMAKSRPSRQSSLAASDRGDVRRTQTTFAEPRPVQTTRFEPVGSAHANQTVVRLESGGTVTLNVAVDLFQLSERDRYFILELIDLTKRYTEEDTYKES